MLEPCVLVGLDWTEPMMILLFHVTWSCIIHAYVPFFSLFLVYLLIGAFLLVSLSLSLSLSLSWIVCAWHPSANPLCPRTLFISRHHLLLILLPYMSGFVMRRPVRTSQRTSRNVAFIRNTTLSYQTSSILIYWLSFTGEDGNLYVRS